MWNLPDSTLVGSLSSNSDVTSLQGLYDMDDWVSYELDDYM